MKLEQHELSAAFPSMTDTELIALTDDVSIHGQRDAGTLFEGKVLDGWHRYQACELAGIQFNADQYIGDDPVGFVMSRNAHRRHLTASQRAAAIVLCSEWKAVGRPGNGDMKSPLRTVPEMAAAADTSERTIQRAKAAVQAGQGEAVRDGKVSLTPPKKSKVLEPDDDIPEPEQEPFDPVQLKADVALVYAEADDRMRQLIDENNRLRAANSALESRNNGLMNELAAARNQCKALQRKVEKAEKEKF